MRAKAYSLMVAMGLLAGAAQAGTLYWSGDGSSQGGSGTWDTNTARWGASGGGPFDTVWTNANSDTAIFGSTAGAVTLGTNVQVGGLRFDSSGYTLGGAYTLGFGVACDITNNIGNIAFANGVIVTNFSGTVYIGYNGSGKSLSINNGGQWYGGTVYVGYGSAAPNAANNSYNIGGAGAATTVSNGAIYVGWATGGGGAANYNTMTVSNATLQMGGTLTIAHCGNGVDNNKVIVDNQGSILLGNNGIVILGGSDYNYPAYGSNNGLVITNGGYVSAGSLTVNYNGNPGNLCVAKGGTLVTAGANAVNGLATIIGGGGGPTSTWNLTSNDLVVSASGNTGTLTVDGNGVAGGAVVTNALGILVGSPGSGSGTMVMTNGAKVFGTSVWVGKSNPGASSNNKLTIVGGAGVTSVLNAGTGPVTVGYLPTNTGSDNNQLIIDAGGILTNAGPMLVGYGTGRTWNGISNDKLVVTNGGQLFTTGNSGICYDLGASALGSDVGHSVTVSGTNSSTGAASLWNLGGGNLTVGYNAGSIPAYSNGLTVSSGGILTNAGLITIGGGSSKSYQNSMTVSNATISSVGLAIGSNSSSSNSVTVSGNSAWNFGGGNLVVGNTANSLALNGGVMTNINVLTFPGSCSLSLGVGARIFANVATNAGTLAVGIDSAEAPDCSCLAVAGHLNITGVPLTVTVRGMGVGVHVIATYGSLTGTFVATNGLPARGKLEYAFGGNRIAVLVPAQGTVVVVK